MLITLASERPRVKKKTLINVSFTRMRMLLLLMLAREDRAKFLQLKSSVTTKYKDGAILPARDFSLGPARPKIIFWCFIPYHLLTKLVRSRWLDIGLAFFYRVYGTRLRLDP